MSEPTLPLRFDADGLVPAVIQDPVTQAVLMLGFMNETALAATRATGRVHFWSRSRQRLWRKGETSGHELVVHDIFVNCDQNSLLITATPQGAVCHDGYPTCYYRRLEPDNHLTVVRDRVFDPAAVYRESDQLATTPVSSPGPVAEAASLTLAELSAAHTAAFARLRDEDFTAHSRTSVLLRDPKLRVTDRVADELRELAGALDGSHRHQDQRADVILEAGQVIYWVTIATLQQEIPWATLRPDLALTTVTADLPPPLLPRLLRRDADHWVMAVDTAASIAAPAHATLALVGQALASVGVTPEAVLAADLAALLAKPYFPSPPPSESVPAGVDSGSTR